MVIGFQNPKPSPAQVKKSLRRSVLAIPADPPKKVKVSPWSQKQVIFDSQSLQDTCFASCWGVGCGPSLTS